jgi:hypothetical protein
MKDERQLQARIKTISDNGEWTAIASAPTVDRDREIVAAHALWWSAETLPVHDRHGGELIGSCTPWYKGDTLYVAGRFASTDRAQTIRALVVEGHMQTMSVMFVPESTQPGTGGVRTVITGGELLSIDFEPVPSNREARVLTSRGYRGGTNPYLDARRLLADAQMVIARSLLPDRTPMSDARTIIHDAEALVDALSFGRSRPGVNAMLRSTLT